MANWPSTKHSKNPAYWNSLHPESPCIIKIISELCRPNQPIQILNFAIPSSTDKVIVFSVSSCLYFKIGFAVVILLSELCSPSQKLFESLLLILGGMAVFHSFFLSIVIMLFLPLCLLAGCYFHYRPLFFLPSIFEGDPVESDLGNLLVALIVLLQWPVRYLCTFGVSYFYLI